MTQSPFIPIGTTATDYYAVQQQRPEAEETHTEVHGQPAAYQEPPMTEVEAQPQLPDLSQIPMPAPQYAHNGAEQWQPTQHDTQPQQALRRKEQPKPQKPTQPKKVELPAPIIQPGIEPPHHGWPRLKWRCVNKPLGLRDKKNPEYYRVPIPNTRERQVRYQEIADYKLWYGLAWYITYLHELRILPGNNITIGNFNPKGQSGKTAILIAICSCATWVVPDLPMLALPVSLRPSWGDLGTLSGLYREDDSRWRISDYYDHLAEIDSTYKLYGSTPSTPAGLHVIGEDKKLGEMSRTMTPDQQFKLIDHLRPLAFGGMGLDMNNEVVSDDGFVYGALDRLDVIVLSSMTESSTSRNNLRQSITDLQLAPDRYQGYNPERPVSIQQKLSKAITVVNAVRPGNEIDFSKYLGLNAKLYHTQTFTNPFEPTLHSENDEEQVAYHHLRVARAKLLTDLQITAACYESGAKMHGLGEDVANLRYSTKPDLELASQRLGRDLSWLAHPKPYQKGF